MEESIAQAGTHRRAQYFGRATIGTPGRVRLAVVACAALIAAAAPVAGSDEHHPPLQLFPDPTGVVANSGAIELRDLHNPFFQSLGSNGRSCATCHQPSDAFGLSAAHARQRNRLSRGTDPLFARVDGSNCPTGPVDHSLLTDFGLIRVGIEVPASAEFTIAALRDPYGCALTFDSHGKTIASVYRRPLPSTNLRFLTTIMIDGRETARPLADASSFYAHLTFNLQQQALHAILGHAEAITVPTADVLRRIVEFELELNSAQQSDQLAGRLWSEQSVNGGVGPLATEPFYPGINDSLGGDPLGSPFLPEVFALYALWGDSANPQRASIARGEQIFNEHALYIANVAGLTGGSQQITGTCTTCHDTPGAGNHSLPLALDIGVSRSSLFETDSDVSASLRELHAPELPVFQINCMRGGLTGQRFYTTDPGKALITGLCTDVGRGKGLILRGLAARAPYFHNGAAKDLTDVVRFYNRRFRMNLTPQEIEDLTSFLLAL